MYGQVFVTLFCYNKQSQNLLIVGDGNPDYLNFLWSLKKRNKYTLFLLAIFSDEVMDDLSKIATWLVQETKSNGQSNAQIMKILVQN